MAGIRTMMDEDPSPRSSSETRHAFTVALVKPGRCSSRYQSKNSFRPMLYTLFVMGDLTESSTRPFIRRHSFALSTTVNSFILNPLMGNIGSHEDLTSGRSEHSSMRRSGPASGGSYFFISGGLADLRPRQIRDSGIRFSCYDSNQLDRHAVLPYGGDGQGVVR